MPVKKEEMYYHKGITDAFFLEIKRFGSHAVLR
jgi:hypothetical protein